MFFLPLRVIIKMNEVKKGKIEVGFFYRIFSFQFIECRYS